MRPRLAYANILEPHAHSRTTGGMPRRIGGYNGADVERLAWRDPISNVRTFETPLSRRHFVEPDMVESWSHMLDREPVLRSCRYARH